jgi:hypothetical protein
MELFTATEKLKKVSEMFDACTTGDRAHTDTMFKFLPHTRFNIGASIIFTASGRNVNYDEKQITGGKKIFELFLLSVHVS